MKPSRNQKLQTKKNLDSNPNCLKKTRKLPGKIKTEPHLQPHNSVDLT